MDKSEIREEARLYFVPFFLGDNSLSHKLSNKIYVKHKIVSYILDTKKSIIDFLDFTSVFWLLYHTQEDGTILTQLKYLSKQFPYTLPILIPCTKEYTELVERNKDFLEAYFIISNPDDIIHSSPLNVIP